MPWIWKAAFQGPEGPCSLRRARRLLGRAGLKIRTRAERRDPGQNFELQSELAGDLGRRVFRPSRSAFRIQLVTPFHSSTRSCLR